MQKQVNIIGGTHTISAHDFNANYVYYHELGRKYPDVICAWQAKEERGESRVLVVCPIFKSTGEAPELLLKAKASTYEKLYPVRTQYAKTSGDAPLAYLVQEYLQRNIQGRG